MDTLNELKREGYELKRDANKARCHKCGEVDGPVDLVQCTDIRCDRSVCSDCATELEWELEACADHALNVFREMRDMYRNALRRANGSENAKRVVRLERRAA